MSYSLHVVATVVLMQCANLASAADLFRDEDYRSLTSDRRAYQVGDVLTVLVVENSSATATAGTKADKGADIGGHASTTTPPRKYDFALGFSENFDGGGRIARTGRVAAQISVAVVDIEANGDLRIKGEQNLEINDEKQAIRVEGTVRRADISETNTVMSSRISNAQITYIGDGILAESQHKGWLTRVLSFLGLI